MQEVKLTFQYIFVSWKMANKVDITNNISLLSYVCVMICPNFNCRSDKGGRASPQLANFTASVYEHGKRDTELQLGDLWFQFNLFFFKTFKIVLVKCKFFKSNAFN